MREGGKAGGRGEEREREVTETIIQEDGHVSDEREVEICVETVHCPPPLHPLRGIIMQWLIPCSGLHSEDQSIRGCLWSHH